MQYVGSNFGIVIVNGWSKVTNELGNGKEYRGTRTARRDDRQGLWILV